MTWPLQLVALPFRGEVLSITSDIAAGLKVSAMADPFPALGLAGNIITFIDFSWKLLSGAHSIYRSHSGTSESNEVLEMIARDVSTLSKAVRVEQSSFEDSNIYGLAKETKRVADELLKALEKLKVQGRTSRWKSLKAALKDVWSREEIEDLEQRLSKLQAQVTAHVQHLMGSGKFPPCTTSCQTDTVRCQEQTVRHLRGR
jgi:hypothetical protein